MITRRDIARWWTRLLPFKGGCRVGLLILQCLILLNSCSEEQLDMTRPVEVTSYVSWFEEDVAVTRAWAPPTGYSKYDIGDKSIGICFTQNGKEPMKGQFFESSGKWRTNIEDIKAEDYYLYGYAPHSAGISCEISSTATPEDWSKFDKGAVMKLKNVPTITGNDMCVVIGAKEGPNKETDNGLRRGDFKYSASASQTGNFVFLLFDHIYAALNINIKVHGDYDELRTIKLKNISLRSISSGSPTKEKTDITVTLAANDGTSNPISSVSFAPNGADSEEYEVFKSSEGTTLTTGYQSFVSYFMPTGVTKFIMTSVYDIYDKKGNKVREDCKATNGLVLSELFDRFEEAEKIGTRYNINLTIQPTYLYMLSEPDLNNPTMTIN